MKDSAFRSANSALSLNNGAGLFQGWQLKIYHSSKQIVDNNLLSIAVQRT
jgi:hypothetical protein